MFDWNEQNVARLSALVMEGLSSGEIASVFSTEHGREMTRNAIIGIMLRKGIKSCNTYGYNGKREPRVPRKKKESFRVRALVARSETTLRNEALCVPDDSGIWESVTAIPLVSRNEAQCPWPIGPVMELSRDCCGAQKVSHVPYCARHQAIAGVEKRR